VGLIGFLLQAVVISLSGVMAPGPVTAVTLAAGTRSRHAGALMAVGHGIVEFPLMLLIMAGMGTLFQLRGVTTGIGFVGGAFLLFMGAQILAGLSKRVDPTDKYVGKSPVWIGIILTGGNPYFLLWWATVGLALTTRALRFGPTAFALFAVIHWLCDLIWLETLSWASFKGARTLGLKSQRIVLAICALALILVGLIFLYDAGSRLPQLETG